MTIAPPAITPLEGSRIDDAARVLGRAFFDDPPFVWIVPDGTGRERLLPWFMRNVARYGQRYGAVHSTGERVEGAAIWLPPGERVSDLRMARLGFAAAPFKLGLPALMRMVRAMGLMDRLHKRDMPQPHWYLMTLGVDPPRQGQGLGGALIAPVLARADAEGLPCYLETAKERNLTFYRRHGFDVLVDITVPNGGPRMWTMTRQPAR